jgi:hypothetical protein
MRGLPMLTGVGVIAIAVVALAWKLSPPDLRSLFDRPGRVQTYFFDNCLNGILAIKQAKGQSWSDQEEKDCRSDATLKAEAFKTATAERRIDLMMRSCIAYQAALMASAAKDETSTRFVSQLAVSQCKTDIAENYDRLK